MTKLATGQSDEHDLVGWVLAVGEVTIPLLAGFSVTFVIVLSDDAANFRWPGAAILTLTIAALWLIAAVQCAYHARLYLPIQATGSKAEPSSRRAFTGRSGRRWAGSTRMSYHCGVVALLAGLGLALAPLDGKGTEGLLRWSASGMAFFACVGEAGFIVFRRLGGARRT